MFCDVLIGDLRKVYLNEEKITITEVENLLLVMWKINQYGQTVIVHSNIFAIPISCSPGCLT